MAEIMHIVLPYDLHESTLISELEPRPHRPVKESLEWLATHGGEVDGELERIFTSVAALLSKGVDLQIALETALVWERG